MSNERRLHIICHDVPYPPDYGGVVDLYYKLAALNARAVKIKLHCFLNTRPAQEELKKYCREITYYKRQTGRKGFSFTTPYIVNSRSDNALLQNLLKDEDPVLMEGVHCTAFAKELVKRNRKVVLRLHNVESDYYRQLYHSERNLVKKLYFLFESNLLEKYERNLPAEMPVITVSENDAGVYKENFGKMNVYHLPVFIPYTTVSGNTGMGNFCLYQGNLSVPENEKAALWLLNKVFTKVGVPFVIAGKDPSDRLTKMAQLYQHTCLVANPSEKDLNDLISKAHINILPSFNNTGIKLKLVNALYNGRHCVVNDATVAGSGLEPACHIAANANATASIISQLYHQPFAEEEIALRRKLLPAIFNNEANAERLIQWIW